MIRGRVFPRTAIALLLTPALLSTLPAAPAAPVRAIAAKSANTTTHSKNAHPATFVSADDEAVHVTLADGTALDAAIHPSSLFLRDGLAASPSDFKPGAKVLLRTRTRASDGVVSVVMLSDPATEAAIDTYRRKPLVGHIVSVADKTLVVQPDGAPPTPLTLHTTAKADCTVSCCPAPGPTAA